MPDSSRPNYAPSEGYVMSEQDKDAVIGKAVRERAEACKAVAMLLVRLRSISEQYRDAAIALERGPEKVAASGEGIDGRL